MPKMSAQPQNDDDLSRDSASTLNLEPAKQEDSFLINIKNKKETLPEVFLSCLVFQKTNNNNNTKKGHPARGIDL